MFIGEHYGKELFSRWRHN